MFQGRLYAGRLFAGKLFGRSATSPEITANPATYGGRRRPGSNDLTEDEVRAQWELYEARIAAAVEQGGRPVGGAPAAALNDHSEPAALDASLVGGDGSGVIAVAAPVDYALPITPDQERIAREAKAKRNEAALLMLLEML